MLEYPLADRWLGRECCSNIFVKEGKRFLLSNVT